MIILGLLIIVIFLWLYLYIWYENNTLKTTIYEIEDDSLPVEFNNYKIAHISDFHNEKSPKLNSMLLDSLQKQKPDIIVITGDLIDTDADDFNISFTMLENIQKIAPVYFVYGNHEAILKRKYAIPNGLKDLGITQLRNEKISIEKDGAKINLIGLDDPKFLKDKFTENEDIIKYEINKIDFSDKEYNILLCHRPELIDIYIQNNFNLVFTGHAHGGQIRVPFIGGLYAPHQGWFPKYTNGVFQGNNTTMVVSRGIGNSRKTFRINNKPELVIVKLSKD